MRVLTRVSWLCKLNWVLPFAPATTSLSPKDTINNARGTDLIGLILSISAP